MLGDRRPDALAEPGPAPWRAVLQLEPALWVLLGLLYFSLDRGRQPGDPTWFLALRSAVWAAAGLCVSLGLVALYARFRIERWSLPRLAALMPLMSVLGGLLWLILFSYFDAEEPASLLPVTQLPTDVLFSELMNFSLALLSWHAAVFFLAQREHAAFAQRRAIQAQLEALRMQLRPHFLFNALNSVVSLIDIDPKRAQALLIELSELLRAVLSASEGRAWTVESELGLLRRYLDIERARYGEQLEVEVTDEAAAHPRELPALILLPLVDNAVKHGMSGGVRPQRVQLSLREEGGALWAEVKNLGSLSAEGPRPPGTGAGFENAARRAEAHGGSLELLQDGPWVCARLRLPLREAR